MWCSVEIPALQLALVETVAAATSAAKKPLIVVVMSGGFLDLTPWKSDPRINAMLWTGCKLTSADTRSAACACNLPCYTKLCRVRTSCCIDCLRALVDPGMMGGQAIAEAIFGVVAPSGRLPYSIRAYSSIHVQHVVLWSLIPDEVANLRCGLR
jgi:hypothetical protein